MSRFTKHTHSFMHVTRVVATRTVRSDAAYTCLTSSETATRAPAPKVPVVAVSSLWSFWSQHYSIKVLSNELRHVSRAQDLRLPGEYGAWLGRPHRREFYNSRVHTEAAAYFQTDECDGDSWKNSERPVWDDSGVADILGKSMALSERM